MLSGQHLWLSSLGSLTAYRRRHKMRRSRHHLNKSPAMINSSYQTRTRFDSLRSRSNRCAICMKAKQNNRFIHAWLIVFRSNFNLKRIFLLRLRKFPKTKISTRNQRKIFDRDLWPAIAIKLYWWVGWLSAKIIKIFNSIKLKRTGRVIKLSVTPIHCHYERASHNINRQ